MIYPRPENNDFENANPGETLVASWLGGGWHNNTDSTDDMDFTSDDVGGPPHWAIDVKEKMQPLSFRWKRSGVPLADTFVLDELSVRKALTYGHRGYFVLHDVPLERWFLASAVEICMGDHVRVDRVGPTGWAKGKWLLDLTQFRMFDPDHGDELSNIMERDMLQAYHLQSCCMKGES